jgi:hypothetical protein
LNGLALLQFWLTRGAAKAGDPFAIQLRAGSSLRLKNGYAQDDTVHEKQTARISIGSGVRACARKY